MSKGITDVFLVLTFLGTKIPAGMRQTGGDLTMRAWLILTLLIGCVGSAAANTGCAKGVVTDDSGRPLNGASVTLFPLDHSLRGRTGSTGDDGRFNLSLAPGRYRISIDKRSFRNGSREHLFYPENNLEIFVPDSSDCAELNPRLAPVASLVLKGRDAATGEYFQRRMEGELLVQYGRSFDSRLIKVVLVGDALEVSSHADLHVRIGMNGYQETEFTIPALQAEEKKEYEFTLPAVVPGCLVGTITDEHKHPLSGASISLKRVARLSYSPRGGRSTADGSFRINNLDPGTYNVFGFKESDGYIVHWQEPHEVIIPGSSHCEELNFAIGPRAGRIVVTVLDAKTEKPINTALTLRDPRPERHPAYAQLYRTNSPISIPADIAMILEISVGGGRSSDPITLEPVHSGETKEITVTFGSGTAHRQ